MVLNDNFMSYYHMLPDVTKSMNKCEEMKKSKSKGVIIFEYCPSSISISPSWRHFGEKFSKNDSYFHRVPDKFDRFIFIDSTNQASKKFLS